jgi:hypothetical protein
MSNTISNLSGTMDVPALNGINLKIYEGDQPHNEVGSKVFHAAIHLALYDPASGHSTGMESRRQI